jgi:hypothetical protein
VLKQNLGNNPNIISTKHFLNGSLHRGGLESSGGKTQGRERGGGAREREDAHVQKAAFLNCMETR